MLFITKLFLLEIKIFAETEINHYKQFFVFQNLQLHL